MILEVEAWAEACQLRGLAITRSMTDVRPRPRRARSLCIPDALLCSVLSNDVEGTEGTEVLHGQGHGTVQAGGMLGDGWVWRRDSAGWSIRASQPHADARRGRPVVIDQPALGERCARAVCSTQPTSRPVQAV